MQLRRLPSHPRGLPLVATQALVRATPRPDQAQELAEVMLKQVVGSGLRPKYSVFDTHYSAGWFTKVVGRLEFLGGNFAPSHDHTLARSEAIRRRVGPWTASEVAQASRDARRERERLRAQVRLLAVGRAQKPL